MGKSSVHTGNGGQGCRLRNASARGSVRYTPGDPCYSGAGSVVRAEVGQQFSKRRTVASPADVHGCTNDLTGIAISGGGVRSATFALGVLIEFPENNLTPLMSCAPSGTVGHDPMLQTNAMRGYLAARIVCPDADPPCWRTAPPP